MRCFALVLIFVSSVASAQFVNKKLADAGDKQLAGAAVAVSPRSNKNIVVYAAGKVMYSNDAGANWNASTFEIPTDIKGTPVVASDTKGNFFVIYSKFTDIVCHHSTDDGKTWSEPVIVSGTPGKDVYDPGVVTSPKKEDMMITWTQSDKYESKDDSCKSEIMMSSSGNGGKKWDSPIRINQQSGNCLDEDFTLRGSYPLIVFDGKTFVIWSSQGAMFYDRSYDGKQWISSDLAIIEQVGGWTLNVPGFGGLANTARVTVDNSGSRIHGTLFLTYSDVKSGESDSDIWLTRSVNRGDNWTVPARINQDKPGRYQFLPRISIDPTTGFVYILYYDRRDYTDNQTDVYLSWSTDGGNQFKEKKLTEKPFVADLSDRNYLEDYLNISVHKGVIVPVWIAINNGKQEVYTTVIKHEELK